MQVNVHEAKTNLSRLIAKAMAGQEVVIAKAGKPVVKLVAIPKQTGKRVLGSAMNDPRFVLKEGWDAPLTDKELADLFGIYVLRLWDTFWIPMHSSGPSFSHIVSPDELRTCWQATILPTGSSSRSL